MATHQKPVNGPLLRPDLSGYHIDGRSVDGFADRPDRPLHDRVLIARLSRRYSPNDLSPAQRRLLRESGEGVPTASELLRGFAKNDADVASVEDDGFLEELTEEELRLVSSPSSHPKLGQVSYPLSIGELEALSGASARQLRHWADAGLLPVAWVSGQRRFYSASVVRALVLARSDTYQVTALASIARGEPEGMRLVRLVASTAASLARSGLSPRASAPYVKAARTLADLPASMQLNTDT